MKADIFVHNICEKNSLAPKTVSMVNNQTWTWKKIIGRSDIPCLESSSLINIDQNWVLKPLACS